MPTNQLQPRSVVQFNQGQKKGLFAQVIEIDGELKFLCRDWDGSQRIFEGRTPDDSFFVVGTAALGPGIVAPRGLVEPMSTVPPPLNPEELLAPLPPEVKAQPMAAAVDLTPPPKPKKKRPGSGFKKIVPGTPKIAYIARVKNAIGDEAEVTVMIAEGFKPTTYNGPASLQARKVIPDIKPFTVMEWRRKE